MSFKKCVVVGCVVVVCTIFAVLGLNIGNKKITLQEVYHSRDYECEFGGYMYETEKLENQYYFSKDCFSEDEAIIYIKELENEIAFVQKKMKEVSFFGPKALKIFVLPSYDTLEIIDRQEALIISKNDLETGDYKLPLFLHACNLYADSKNYGAYAFVHQMPFDNNKIAQYLKDEKNREVLDLFYARAYTLCESKENVEMFQQILSSLAAYLIEKEGLETYLVEDISAGKIEEWLEQFSIVLNENEKNICRDQVLFLRDGKYQMHMVNGQAIYHVVNYEKDFENVTKLRDLIWSEIESREKVKTYLDEQQANCFLDDKDFSIIYEIDQQDKYSVAVSDEKGSVIKLRAFNPATVVHEMTHAIQMIYGDDKIWLNEGMACYFAQIYFMADSEKEVEYQNFLSNKEWQDYYRARKAMPSNMDEFDQSLYYSYLIYDYFNNNMQSDRKILAIKIKEAPEYKDYLQNRKVDGEEISYFEAMSFVEYLIERFTFKEVWECLTTDQSFQDIFGENYKELKIGWQRSVLDR